MKFSKIFLSRKSFGVSQRPVKRYLPKTWLLVLYLIATPVAQAGQLGSCIDRYNIADNGYYADLNCTANESAISSVELFIPADDVGCLEEGDNVQYEIRIGLSQGNTDRYDTGLYLNVLGGSARTDTRDSACYQEILLPNTNDSGTWDLTGGLGPFPEYDGNFADSPTDADDCGDIDTASFKRFLMDSTNTNKAQVDFLCSDANENGRLDFSGCVAYANNSGQELCGSFTTDRNGVANDQGAGSPGTKSKCSCGLDDDTVPPIPIADISSSCSCTHQTGTASYDCTVTASNTAPASLSPTLDDAFNYQQPGTAAYVRYKINDWISSDLPGVLTDAGGSFVLGTATNGTASLMAGGADVLLAPQGGRCVTGVTCADPSPPAAPEDYVLGPGQTTTLQFTYTNTVLDELVTLQFDTYKGATNSFAVEEVRQTNVQCQVLASTTTYSAIGQVSASVEHDEVVLEWETIAEAATEGFDVYRQDSANAGTWVKVNAELVPSAQNFSGGRYQLKDPGAEPGKDFTYRIVERDRYGNHNELGPFMVSAKRGNFQALALTDASLQPSLHNDPMTSKPLPALEDRSFSVTPKGTDQAFIARLEQAQTPASVTTRGKSQASTQGQTQGRKIPATPVADALKFIIDQDGFYSIEAGEIAAVLGMSSNDVIKLIKKYGFGLSNQGLEVAWEAGADNLSVDFYAQANTSRYSRENTYWLRTGKGKKISSRKATAAEPTDIPQGFSETLVAEKDLLTSPFYEPAPNDDFQFWKRVRSSDPGGTTFSLASPASIDLGGSILLKIEVIRSAGPGQGTVSVNELPGCSANLNWLGADTVDVSLPQSCLLDVNDVVIRSLDGNFVVDSISLTYARQYIAADNALAFRRDDNATVTITGFSHPGIRVYDLTDALEPKLLTHLDIVDFGSDYGVSLVPGMSASTHLAVASAMAPLRIEPYTDTGLRDTGNRGNYLVIAKDNFAAAAQPLLDLRSSGSTEPMFVNLQHIMDEFNDGNFSPEAIAEFLRYAAENWQLAPTAAVLIGKGHFDFLNDQGLDNNPMPPLVQRTTGAYVPGDNLLGDIDGDGIPEIAMGRIPVLSAAELTSYISKLVEYEHADADVRDMLVHMVADAVDYRAGDFPFDSQQIISLLPGSLNVLETFLFDPWTTEEARSRLLESFSEGALLVNLIGHGNPVAFSGYPHSILTRTDAQNTMLLGPGQSPMVVALSCLISTHAIPGVQSLGEDLVMNTDGGAIAVLGPLGLSENLQSVNMGKKLLPGLLESGSGTIGAAYIEAMQQFVASGGSTEYVQLFGLLGDPMIKLRNQ